MNPPPELIGQCAGIVAVLEHVQRLVRHEPGQRRFPPILLQGESGTGKGLVASLLHAAGPRRDGPFVGVNCAAIPDALLEAEMFGFERGAFTDARRAKPGLMQVAHRGTLLLDEIGLLPEALQAKLLTVIEERSVRRLGSTRAEPVDIAIIAASASDLAAAVRAGRFREDLYHRLAVVTLRLPPLRDRADDILVLADHFLNRVCADYGLPPRALTPDARAALLAHPWPGNVRELANVIERAALLGQGETINAEALQIPSDRAHPPRLPGPPVDHCSAEALHQALVETGWNVSRAAARLGVSRNAARYWIGKHGLRPGAPAPVGATLDTPRGEVVGPAPPPERPSGRALRWERRHIALLSAALEDDGEAVAAAGAHRAIEAAVDKVEAFGGRITEIGPTRLVAAFGLEQEEDAVRRAAHAALAIVNATTAARTSAPARADVPLTVGVHAGEVTVGRLGETTEVAAADRRQAVILLDDLTRRATPGHAVVTEAALPFLRRQFHLVPDHGSGDGSLNRLVRYDATFGTRSWMPRFVGRAAEIDHLQRMLGLAAGGSGQAVALVGEPGVGKSRLLWEFTRSADVRGWRILETAATPDGRTVPYRPAAHLIRGLFDAAGHGDPRQVLATGAERCRSLGLPVPALLALLDRPVDDPAWRALDPPQRRHQMLEVAKRLLLEESRGRPLLVAVEDLHWTDAETIAVLASLIEALPPARLFLLFTYRPEFQHGWGGRACYSQLRVDPLSAAAVAQLLDEMLGGDASLTSLRRTLLDRAEGNPFFLEESIRQLEETGVLTGARGDYRIGRHLERSPVPDTVQVILAARIHRLPARERTLIECSAVIGRTVSIPLLRATAGLGEADLEGGLEGLQAAELLHEAHRLPELAYRFRHALTQEVAYQSLEPEQRRALHGRLVEAIEMLYPGRLAEHVDGLAYHALGAGLWAPALEYFRQTGAKAGERNACLEAAASFEQALVALGHLPLTKQTIEAGIDLRLELNNWLAMLGRLERWLALLSEAEVAARQLDDPVRLGRVTSLLIFAHWWMGAPDRALAAGGRALDLAARLGDITLEAQTRYRLGFVYMFMGDYGKAVEAQTRVVALLSGEAVPTRFGSNYLLAVCSLMLLGWCLAFLGDFEAARAHGDRSLKMAEETGHEASLTFALNGAGGIDLLQGDAEAAVARLRRALDVWRGSGSVQHMATVHWTLGQALTLLGRGEEAVTCLERAVEISGDHRQMAFHPRDVVGLSEAYLVAGRLEDAMRTVQRGLELSRRHGQAWGEADSLRILGGLLSAQTPPDLDGAHAALGEALRLAESLGMRPLVARCHLALAQCHGLRGEPADAQRRREVAKRMFGEMRMAGWVERLESAPTSCPGALTLPVQLA